MCPSRSDFQLDVAALKAVRAAGQYPSYDNARMHHDGPLPPQRLTGLTRRGLLRRDSAGYYRLTKYGERVLEDA